MKCKVFKIHLENESDELKLNKFLEDVELKQVFASIVHGDENFWSVLAFYEDEKKAFKTNTPGETLTNAPESLFKLSANTYAAAAANEQNPPEKIAPEPIVLTAEQENDFNNLKKWRNERAAQDGLPPYMIAHNDSLMQIAASSVRSREDLLQIKGFGEKRAEKYGDEILNILNKSETTDS